MHRTNYYILMHAASHAILNSKSWRNFHNMLQKLSMRLISIALLLLLQIFWRGEVVTSSIIFQLQFIYKAKTSLVCVINLSSKLGLI